MNPNADPHFWQVVAWRVSLLLFVLSFVQLWFNMRREARERRQQRAKFSFELLDALFDDPKAGALIHSLDAGFASAVGTTDAGTGVADGAARRPATTRRRGAKNQELAHRFARAFGSEYGAEDEALVEVRMQFDVVLYYLDRFHHAVRADLAVAEDLHPPLRYIVRLLQPLSKNIENYATFVGYQDAVKFLRGFQEWEAPPKASREEINS